MEIAGTTTARADSKFSGEVSFCSRREGGTFFMPHMDPLDALFAPKRTGDRVERISHHTIDSFDAAWMRVPANTSATFLLIGVSRLA
jgi:hypothetical protein